MNEDKNINKNPKQPDEVFCQVELRVIPPTNTFENIDCMEMLKKCPDKHFDLAIVDPPYGIGVADREKFRGNFNCDEWKNRESNMKLYTPKKWDNNKPGEAYFTELFRVSKNQIVWGGNYFIENLKNTSCMIVWDKKVTDNSADCELAWTSFNTAVRKFNWLWNGYKKQQPEERFHPTQKPLALYKWLLHKYAKPGDLILDTHVGSGSSIIACIEGGFNYYGCEIDKDYYDAARRRIARAFRRYELFENEAV